MWVHLGALFFISAMTALVTSLARWREARTVVRETAIFFVLLGGGIFVFGGFVAALEWIFVRSPI
jgi:hypothetical protein